MALKQNFEWFGNNNPALILNSMALVGIGNWVGFLRSGICSRSGFGFSDANKTIHASSLKRRLFEKWLLFNLLFADAWTHRLFPDRFQCINYSNPPCLNHGIKGLTVFHG